MIGSVVAIPEAKVKMHEMRWFCFILIWLPQEWCQNCMGNLINCSEVKLVHVFLRKKDTKSSQSLCSANCEFCLLFSVLLFVGYTLGQNNWRQFIKRFFTSFALFWEFPFLFLIYIMFPNSIQKTLTITSLTSLVVLCFKNKCSQTYTYNVSWSIIIQKCIMGKQNLCSKVRYNILVGNNNDKLKFSVRWMCTNRAIMQLRQILARKWWSVAL